MSGYLIWNTNVIFELYKACLDGEITKSEFLKAKEIVSRCRPAEEVRHE